MTQLAMVRRLDVGKRRQLVGTVDDRQHDVGPTSSRPRSANGWQHGIGPASARSSHAIGWRNVGRTTLGRRTNAAVLPTVHGCCAVLSFDYRLLTVDHHGVEWMPLDGIMLADRQCSDELKPLCAVKTLFRQFNSHYTFDFRISRMYNCMYMYILFS